MKTQVEIKKPHLTEEDRKQYLTQILTFMQRHNPPKLPMSLTTQVNHISVDYIKNDADYDELKAIMDTLLWVIQEHRHLVHTSVYLKLMHVCNKTQNFIFAYQIAYYLYHIQHFIHGEAIQILMVFANETGKPNA